SVITDALHLIADTFIGPNGPRGPAQIRDLLHGNEWHDRFGGFTHMEVSEDGEATIRDLTDEERDDLRALGLNPDHEDGCEHQGGTSALEDLLHRLQAEGAPNDPGDDPRDNPGRGYL